ncbi:MAG: HepT-like ribonuclease domain-containing protein [Casimicrobiaceae bacterium]
MLDAAEQALRFCAGRRRDELAADVMLRYALVHAVTIVGEAASRVSEPTRQSLPDVAWPAIVGMRNRLVHAYFEVDVDVLWQSVNEKLSPLVAHVRAALADSLPTSSVRSRRPTTR